MGTYTRAGYERCWPVRDQSESEGAAPVRLVLVVADFSLHLEAPATKISSSRNEREALIWLPM